MNYYICAKFCVVFLIRTKLRNDEELTKILLNGKQAAYQYAAVTHEIVTDDGIAEFSAVLTLLQGTTAHKCLY